MENQEQRSLSILIADDSAIERKVLGSMLNKLGHEVIVAEDGNEAVELFRETSPNLVILDVVMPNLDGAKAAKIIKRDAGDRFVPIMFITSLSHSDSVAECLSAGGDDVLPKPFDKTVIGAKIMVFTRMLDLYTELERRKNELDGHNRHLQAEHHLAKRIFDNVIHAGCIDSPYVRYHISPYSTLNGDLVLAQRRPGGGLHVMIGDFTGHGLPAAVGTVPVADMFYSMTEKGYDLTHIVASINKKLCTILPTEAYCVSIMLDINFTSGSMRVWNGGLPRGIVCRDNKVIATLASGHCPLGVVLNNFDPSVQTVAVEENDKVFLYTDGIIEIEMPDGTMFGEDNLVKLFQSAKPDTDIYQMVLDKVEKLNQANGASDDTTFIELTITDYQDPKPH